MLFLSSTLKTPFIRVSFKSAGNINKSASDSVFNQLMELRLATADQIWQLRVILAGKIAGCRQEISSLLLSSYAWHQGAIVLKFRVVNMVLLSL